VPAPNFSCDTRVPALNCGALAEEAATSSPSIVAGVRAGFFFLLSERDQVCCARCQPGV